MPYLGTVFDTLELVMTSKSGSFGGSVAAAEAAARQQRAEEIAKQTAGETAEKHEAEQQSQIEKEVESKLPENVRSEVLGIVSYAEFKKTYQSIWDQVIDKSHLIFGRIKFETKLAGNQLVVQSMTQREQKALAFYEPSPIGFKEVTPQIRAEQIIDYNVKRIVTQVTVIGDMRFALSKLTPDTRDKWVTDAATVAAMDVVLDMDPMIVNHIIGLFNDLDSAKYYALVENLRNP